MTPIKWIQLALLVMRFANWIAAKIDQATWEASGYRQAMADQAAELQKSIGLAKEAAAKVAAKTDEQVLKDLEARGELRD